MSYCIIVVVIAINTKILIKAFLWNLVFPLHYIMFIIIMEGGVEIDPPDKSKIFKTWLVITSIVNLVVILAIIYLTYR